MSYLGSKYNLEEDVGMPNAPMASSTPAESSMAAAGAGAATKVNPWLLGSSFLLSYLKAKEDEFNRKRKAESDIQNNYSEQQDQALDHLNNAWKAALLK